jgi:GIY-YIG catalytic domain
MTAGVYQILNRANTHCLIGGSSDIESMLDYYLKVLSSETKPIRVVSELLPDSKLSRDWLVYGKNNFSFRILEATKRGRANIKTRLRFWCRTLQPAYNNWAYPPIVSGVYQIVNVKDGYSYVGQSKDIYQRWSTHKGQLKAGIHYNKQFQKSFDKWGESNFELRILEVYQPDLKPLVELEKQWIKKTDNLFNIVV